MNFNGYDQRNMREFPPVIRDVLSGIYEDVISDKTKGKVPTDIDSPFVDEINMIPSRHEGACCHILVAICYDKDDLDQRLKECFDHASIICDGINEEIFFVTTQWNSSIVNKFLGYINSLRKNGVDINMIYVTKRGMVLMPI